VLVAAGTTDGSERLASCELYDPAIGTWTTTGSLATPRFWYAATLLTSGKVLVTGGDNQNAIASCELYDSTSGTWSATGSLSDPKFFHTATLLPNGKVLVAGGADGISVYFRTAELYDPATGTWTETGPLAAGREGHTATLLPSGKVLLAGGNDDNVGYSTDAELYDPATGTWAVTANLPVVRAQHTATLLLGGDVLFASGNSAGGFTPTAKLYHVGLDFDESWRPEISRASFSKSLRLTGSLFQGVSQASGGNTQDSSSNYPVVQLRSIDSEQVVFLPVDPRRGWSDTSFTALRSKNVPPGPALVTVFTNGIPSDSAYLVVPASQR
jgi:hypothetical protein